MAAIGKSPTTCRGFAQGDDYWCQGFSEPGSGSDLSSLKTAAIRVRDEYIVNGSKIWTTHGHLADMMFALVRTSRDQRQQQGISFLLIDMCSEGLEVRPIITIAGDHDVNQVFFDNVRVPAAYLIGDEGKGWEYAKYLLEFERGGGAPSIRCRLALDKYRLILCQANGDGRLIDYEDQQIELGRLEAEVMALEILDMRQVAARQNGQRPGRSRRLLRRWARNCCKRFPTPRLGRWGSMRCRTSPSNRRILPRPTSFRYPSTHGR